MHSLSLIQQQELVVKTMASFALLRSRLVSATNKALSGRSLARSLSYQHSPLFESNIFASDVEYKQIAGPEAVEQVQVNNGTSYLSVKGEALTQLSKQAFSDIAHLLRPAHLQQLRNILDDPEASSNDHFVAWNCSKMPILRRRESCPVVKTRAQPLLWAKRVIWSCRTVKTRPTWRRAPTRHIAI